MNTNITAKWLLAYEPNDSITARITPKALLGLLPNVTSDADLTNFEIQISFNSDAQNQETMDLLSKLQESLQKRQPKDNDFALSTTHTKGHARLHCIGVLKDQYNPRKVIGLLLDDAETGTQMRLINGFEPEHINDAHNHINQEVMINFDRFDVNFGYINAVYAGTVEGGM